MIASSIRSTVADRAISTGGIVNAQSMAIQANVTANAFEIDREAVSICLPLNKFCLHIIPYKIPCLNYSSLPEVN